MSPGRVPCGLALHGGHGEHTPVNPSKRFGPGKPLHELYSERKRSYGERPFCLKQRQGLVAASSMNRCVGQEAGEPLSPSRARIMQPYRRAGAVFGGSLS